MLSIAGFTSSLRTGLSVLLMLGPTAAHAGIHTAPDRPSTSAAVGTASGVAAAEPGPEDAWQAAEELYRRGSTLFEASDYLGAIDAFTQALDIVANDEFDPAVRRALLVNLARVHRRAFLIDDKLLHLTTSADIYRRIASTAPGSEDAQEAMNELPLLEAQIASVKATRVTTSASATPAGKQPAGKTSPSTPATTTDSGVHVEGQGPPPPIAARPPAVDTPTRSGKSRNVKPLKATAVAMYSLGALGVGTFVTGLVLSAGAQSQGDTLVDDDPNRPITDFDDVVVRGQLGNILSYAGGGLAVAALGTGVALSVVAARAKRNSGTRAHLQRSGLTTLPTFGRGQFGVALAGRFTVHP